MHRNRRAAIAALALSFVVAAPTFAATTADVNESFSVTSTLSLTLNKAAIDYGSIDPGSTTQASLAERSVTATVGGNEPSWTLNVTGTSFARTGGGSLPASVRSVKINNGGSFVALPASVTGGGSGTSTWEFNIDLTSHTNASAGSYTGSVTFAVSAN